MPYSKIRSKILLVQDETKNYDFLINTLSFLGYDVHTSSSLELAKDFIVSSDFKMVLSENVLIDGSAVEVLNFLRTVSHNPFIFIADSVESTDDEGHELLNFAILVRPFREKDLLDALGKFLKSQDPANLILNGAHCQNVDDDFSQIDIDEFICGKELRYDIFIHIGDKKFIKLSHGGESLSEDELDRLRIKGVTSLYMRKADFMDYISMTVSLIKYMPKIHISANRKSLFIQKANQLLTESLVLGYADVGAIMHAKTIVEATINMLIGCDEILLTLEFLKKGHTSVFCHSLNVALYSVIIAKKMKMNSSTVLTKLSAASMLHDLGKSKLPSQIVDMPLSELSVVEVQLLESHVLHSSEMLRAIHGLSPEIVQIVDQHHENDCGTGYPEGLGAHSLHPLARILKVADDFCESMQGKIPSMVYIMHTLEMMEEGEHANKYDQTCVAALKSYFIRTKSRAA
jgi:putative nucleotidyltransferase with HDIG domain